METVVKQHAHRCGKCLENGKQVVWVHGDDMKGVETAHKCPECGTVNWQQFLVEPHRLPPQHQHVSPASNPVAYAIGVLLIMAGIALLAYGTFVFIKKQNSEVAQK